MYRFIFVVLVFGALSLFGAVAAEAVDVRIRSVTINPVKEGGRTGIFLRLDGPYRSECECTNYISTERVRIPVTFTALTAEPGDYQTFSEIWIGVGSNGGGGRTISIPIDDDLEDETFRVSLGTLPTGFVARNPSSVVITITDVGGLPPTVSLSVSPNPVTEGSPLTVTARLSGALSNDVTIPLTLRRGFAEDGDYGSLSSITINAGSTTGTGTVTTNQDTDTDNETFRVTFGNLPSSVHKGSPSSVLVTIRDDDASGGGSGGGGGGGGQQPNNNQPSGGGPVVKPRVTLSVSPSRVTEGSPLTVMAHLSSALSNDVTIPLAFSRVTAEDGDYGVLSSITISAGETTGMGTLTTNKDLDFYDEVFQVTLGNLPSSVSQTSRDRVEVIISDVSKIGDFNGDGNVNLRDYALWTDAFGTQRGEAGYDEIYDLDGDGGVGVSDFLIFVENFGK